MSGTSGGEGQVPASEGPGPGQRPEHEAAHEVAEPRGRPPQARRHRFSWRTPVAVLLIIAGCVLAPISVVAVWTANQVSDTSSYVANVTPLIKDPAIQNALTNKLTSEIITKIDVKGRTDQAAAELSQKGFTRIGGLLKGVSGSLASGVHDFAAQPHPQDHHRPADGERMGTGEPGRPPGAGGGVVGPRRQERRRRRQQRPGHPRPGAPRSRRQAGPRRTRADNRSQDPHRP